MFKKMLVFSILSTFSLFPSLLLASPYGKNLCKLPQYFCLKIKAGDSWASLFPEPEQRLLVKKINRTNMPLRVGEIIAVPNGLEQINLLTIAPFPQKIAPSATNLVKVDLSDLAWGAYDKEGNLLNWGPISGGKNYCSDIQRSCRTITGHFTFYDKKGPNCISSRFPVPRGGAPMPYCMHFHGGFALHGSATVPGYNASHGCVRLFFEDAKWLNQDFVKVGSTRVQVVP